MTKCKRDHTEKSRARLRVGNTTKQYSFTCTLSFVPVLFIFISSTSRQTFTGKKKANASLMEPLLTACWQCANHRGCLLQGLRCTGNFTLTGCRLLNFSLRLEQSAQICPLTPCQTFPNTKPKKQESGWPTKMASMTSPAMRLHIQEAARFSWQLARLWSHSGLCMGSTNSQRSRRSLRSFALGTSQRSCPLRQRQIMTPSPKTQQETRSLFPAQRSPSTRNPHCPCWLTTS